MIPMRIQDVKLRFFDTRLMGAADRARWGFLTHAGGYIRKTAINSIKQAGKGKNGGRSLPGQPPFYHLKSPIRYKDTIFYYVDKSESKMYAGAVLLNGRGGHKVPKLLELGGIGTFKDPKTRRMKTGRYRARPHMRPALEVFIAKKQAQLLRHSIVAR